ncbi:hypothetical protein GGX14DRAFT_370195 [Mycena pura]|uniref:Calpain catalytic domain-containing protein n=1 Tax=Mycena pura TaxID=153505 RepID=A0AAD6V8G3_9AGAR|nr:hypothetical protein GGX14DRAFT_370195 [Mycena pura]
MPSSFFKLFKPEAPAPDLLRLPPTQVDVPECVGLLSSLELETVVAECKANVARIAKQCRARNLRYRDIDFDLENDQDRCLNGLVVSDVYNPSDVQRVADLFEKPQFFADGSHSNEIIQGQKCSNCWFISALAATSTVKGLVEKYCVARDEQVGVYGFVFWRDVRWVSVIVDDLLYTSIPKYEELSIAEKALFQNDKEKYNASARKGNKTLYFAKSGTLGETWVPLVEKAYAKLHGDYGSLCSGYCPNSTDYACATLSSGVSSFIQCKDILDKEKFWTDELLNANRDRLFACSFQGLSPTRNGTFNATVSGLWGNHAYAVLRALEHKGKRFLVLRNPCGQAEWNGPWSDGSKDWTPEWMDMLPALGHVFGDPGKFVMEYKDFLLCFEQLDRTRLFDSSWTTRSDMLRVVSRPFPESPLGYGDICFTFSLSKTATTIIVLSQLDVRYFKGISPPCYWNFDFILYRRGQKEPVDMSSHSRYLSRSVSLEFAELEEGEYIVHVSHFDTYLRLLFEQTNADEWSQSKLSRVISQRAISESVATTGQDLTDLSRKALDLKAGKKRRDSKSESKSGDDDESSSKADTKVNDDQGPGTTTTITTITTVRTPRKITTNTKEVVMFGTAPPAHGDDDDDDSSDDEEEEESPKGRRSRAWSTATSTSNAHPPDNAAPFLGLKVYTPKTVDVTIKGQLRYDVKASFEGLKSAEWNSFAI